MNQINLIEDTNKINMERPKIKFRTSKVKSKTKPDMMKKFTKNLVDVCVNYIGEDNNQKKIQSYVLSPTLNYIFNNLYPYLIGFTILFILNFVLLVVLIIMISNRMWYPQNTE